MVLLLSCAVLLLAMCVVILVADRGRQSRIAHQLTELLAALARDRQKQRDLNDLLAAHFRALKGQAPPPTHQPAAPERPIFTPSAPLSPHPPVAETPPVTAAQSEQEPAQDPLRTPAPTVPHVPPAQVPPLEPVTVTSRNEFDIEPVAPRLAGPVAPTFHSAAGARSAARASSTARAYVPPQPSAFEKAAQEALRKMWSWIVVGEDHRPAGVSLEFAIATTWLLRIGVLILLMGIGFFLKYSFEHDLIKPPGRVAIGILIGAGLIAFGVRLLGKAYHLLGEGLIGTGIATLYLSIFAAANRYQIIGLFGAFALMCVITFVAGVLAVRYRSLLVAVLGILGGYGTPIMLSTGEPNFVGLFTYMLVLGIGVLGISFHRNWRLLVWLSFLGNYLLYFLAMRDFTPADFPVVMPYLVAFFVLFSTAVFIFNVVNKLKSNLLELLGLWTNAGVFFGASYQLVRSVYDKQAVAFVTLGLTAFFVAHVFALLRRKVRDRELLLSFTALASLFLALTPPLILSREWITASWAVQAVVMLWIAGKLNSDFLRSLAYVLYAVMLIRVGTLDLPRQYGAGRSDDVLTTSQYLKLLVERLGIFGVPVAALAAGCRLVLRPPAAGTLSVDPANDSPVGVPRTPAAVTIAVLAVGLLFVSLHLEINRSLGFFFPPARLAGLTLLWVGLCVFLALMYERFRASAVLYTLVACVALLVGKLLVVDLPNWSITEHMLYAGNYSFVDASMRLLDFGAIAALLSFVYFRLRGDSFGRPAGVALGTAALIVAFLWSTLELRTALHIYLPGMEAGGVSILWSLFALGLIIAGILRDVREMRYVGLGLFAVVAAKVFFVDLARLEQLYRIIAFIVLGILVLCGSFIYLKFRQVFARATEQGKEAP